MAKIDLSTRVALRASNTIKRVRARLREAIPYGPMQVRLTPREELTALEVMSPDARVELASRIGTDEFLRRVSVLREQVEKRQHGNNESV